uniref:Uncharacterized protein n=1 Tax=Rhizophora mucronata TaxID=61149 RepID=A0A2P2LFJ8_RHIMU
MQINDPPIRQYFTKSVKNKKLILEFTELKSLLTGPDWATVQLQKIRFRCKIIETGSQKAYPLIDNRFPKN